MSDALNAISDRLSNALNPFAASYVTSIRECVCDTARIHAAHFEVMWRAYEQLAATGRSKGILVMGQPGVGKTHLLNRFCRRIRDEGRFLVFQVRPLAGNAVGWHGHILRSIVSDLLHDGDDSGERLDQVHYLLQMLIPNLSTYIVNRVISEEDRKKLVQEYLARRRALLNSAVHPIADDALKVCAYFLLYQVQLHYTNVSTLMADRLPRKIRLCLKWLKGLQLGGGDKRTLNIKADLGRTDDRDDVDPAYLAVLKLLGEMTKGRCPIVLVIDQVETMSDRTAEHFARDIHLLLDEAPNFLVVTSGVDTRIQNFVERRVFQKAAYDRIRDCTVDLEPPPEELYLEMIRDRVTPLILETERNLRDEFRDDRCVFPFTPEILATMLRGRVTVPTPREVVVGMRDLFEECRHHAAELGERWLRDWPNVKPFDLQAIAAGRPDRETISRRLKEESIDLNDKVRKQLRGSQTTADDQELRGCLEEVIRAGTSLEIKDTNEEPGGKESTLHFVVRANPAVDSDRGRESVGVVFDSRAGGAQVFRTIDAIAKLFDGAGTDLGTVLLVRDAKAEFSGSWKRTWELRNELEAKGLLKVMLLEEEQVANLLSLGRQIQSIKAGDLVIERGPLDAYTVTLEDWREFAKTYGIFASDPLLKEFK